jgi:hypothetical protein
VATPFATHLSDLRLQYGIATADPIFFQGKQPENVFLKYQDEPIPSTGFFMSDLLRSLTIKFKIPSLWTHEEPKDTLSRLLTSSWPGRSHVELRL